MARPWTDTTQHPLKYVIDGHGVASPDFDSSQPPKFFFNYTFNQGNSNVINGFVMRNHWEKADMLTTVTAVAQDEDSVCFARRVNYFESLTPPTYETVCILRDGRMYHNVLAPNPNRTAAIIQKSEFKPQEEVTKLQTHQFTVEGSQAQSVEVFKNHVRMIIHAMQFKTWSDQEAQ